MPQCTFQIVGDIAAFDKVDDVYKVLKRDGAKLLTNWTLTVSVEFTEKEVPKV